MDNNDFLGSYAQENVQFTTRVIKTAAVGDNFYKVMVFVEDGRFVDTSETVWTDVPGSTTIKALSVDASDYAEHTTGLLRSWLYDLFCSGFTGDCILVACGDISVTYTYSEVTPVGTENPQSEGWYEKVGEDYVLTTDTEVASGKTYYTRSAGTVDPSAFLTGMEKAYNLLKAYAYHKTVCAGSDAAILPAVAVKLAELCATDKGLLSGAPLLPFTTSTPEDASSDPLYSALKSASQDAFMSAHRDTTRNAALLSIGIALASYNGSGTPVGNAVEMTATGMITSSGPNGTQLPKGVRDGLALLHIQTWKPVGDNTGNVAAFGDMTLNGDVYAATWIIAYITYMTKVRVAQLLTSGNFLKNAANYSSIITVMNGFLSKFGPEGSGRLKNLLTTAPAFEDLPEAADDEIIVPDAWSATYVGNVRDVIITGTLYIGA